MGMLNHHQFREFWEALRSAYRLGSLTIMLQVRLGKRLDEITLADDFQKVVFDVVQDAEMQGYTLRLLHAARESRPDNPNLLAVSQQFGLSSVTPKQERIIRDGLPFLDVTAWRTRLGALEGRVCRVEIPSSGREGEGTGFLVGPDLVLTNYHVIESVKHMVNSVPKGTYQPSDVKVRFDFRKGEDGLTLNPGTTFNLASNWLVDISLPSPADFKDDPNAGLPQADQLDYALLRVEGDPGRQVIGPAEGVPEQRPRGWVQVPAGATSLDENAPLFILQHPVAWPLKLALETQAVVGFNGNRTRLRYRTNTDEGSSGSPCFDQNWKLVALHHAGDPKYQPRYKPQWNQGIPIDAIVRLLTERNLGPALAQPLPS